MPEPASGIRALFVQFVFEPFSEGAAPERVFLRSIESHFGEDSLFERAWCRYVFHKNSALQQAVHAMKYQGMFNLGIFFGKEIGRYIAASGMDCDAIDCIVPVPLNRLKLIERSFNQAEKIAEGMAAVLHKPVEPRMLRRVTYTSSQTGLTLAQRKKNLAGAFEPGRGRIPRRVILVDDIGCSRTGLAKGRRRNHPSCSTCACSKRVVS